MSVLTIDVAVDAAAAAADLDSVATAARGVGDAVAAAGASVEDGATRIDRATESADGLASTSSTLTGALGALGSGLSLVGLEEHAAALESAAMATDFFSGVGDLAALALDSQAIKSAAATAATVAHGAATAAQSAATGIATGAQWALNAALSANPIGLVVIAILALVAGVILAYKNSETFREVIGKAMDAAKAGVDLVVDAVSGFVGDLRALPGHAKTAWAAVSGAVSDAVDTGIDRIVDLVRAVRDKPAEAGEYVAGKFADMFAPIRDAIDWVGDLIAKIKSIDFPDFPSLPDFLGGDGITMGDTAAAATGGSVSAPTVVHYNTINVTQTVGDPVAAAAQIRDILDRADRII